MKKAIILMLLSLSFITLVGCGEKKAAEYKEDLQKVADNMFDNAVKAEDILNQYASVWSHSIESRAAIQINEMTAITGLEQNIIEEYFQINNAGNIPNDFSTNVNALNSYYEGTGQLEEIKKISDDVKTKISELNDPPEEFQKVYDEVLNMYDSSEKYIALALNPTGTLQSFNETKSQLADDIISKHKRIEVLMPNEK